MSRSLLLLAAVSVLAAGLFVISDRDMGTIRAGDGAAIIVPRMIAVQESAAAATIAEDVTPTEPALAVPLSEEGPPLSDPGSLLRSGMLLSLAKSNLLEAGWQAVGSKPSNGSETEAAYRRLGYDEITGCTDSLRPVCRFDYERQGKSVSLLAAGGTAGEARIVDYIFRE